MPRTDIELRRKHALEELHARGVLEKGKMQLFPRMMMSIFRKQVNPYYGSRVLYASQIGFFFALPFAALITPAFMFDKSMLLPWPSALAIGIGIAGVAGALFGTAMSLFKRNVHTRMKLTPWEELDEPPVLEAAEGAETFEDVNEQWKAVAGATALGGAVAGGAVRRSSK